MKKRLLITSIVMMLVVAVALSTATYAWFTSNASVEASSLTINAGAAEGVALGIGWYGGTTGTTIESDDSLALAPMIPTVISTTANSETTLNAFTFNGSSIYTKESVKVFNAASESNVYARTPYTLTESGDGTATVFYLENLSAAKPIDSITLTATISGDAKDLVRIAIFTCGTTYSATESDWKLVEVLADHSATGDGLVTCKGTVSADGPILGESGTALTTYTAATSKNLGGLAVSTSKYFKVIIWLDGDDFVDSFAGNDAEVVLDFQAA